MSDAPTIPLNQTFTGKEGSLAPKKIDKLSPEKRQWSANVMKALGLKSTSSQARLLSEAIASATLIEQTGSNQDKQEAARLRAIVLKAGPPPWKDSAKALAAGEAKAKLDLLSLPPQDRVLKPLDPNNAGVNQAFWIDRQGADGTQRHGFLCKVANDPNAGMDPMAPSGGTKGGEVAREALAGRAGQLIASQLGIDVGMPETHIISIDPGMVPGSTATQPLTCSVQEARPAKSDLRKTSGLVKETLNVKQVVGLAIYDTLTLNTDRHSGNVLLDDKDNLIPIDHGESFAESNPEGIARLQGAMGGPHNTLLGLAAAHAPIPKDMLKQLKSMDPDKYAKGLAKDNAEIGRQHPDMANAISPGAIENARRSAMFLKLAAKHEPPLSAAAVQIALSGAAAQYLDPAVTSDSELKRIALAAIGRLANRQGVLKEVCTAPNSEFSALQRAADALGWGAYLARRSGAPDDQAISDPLVLMTIIKHKIPCPNSRAQAVKLARYIQGVPVQPPLPPGAPQQPITADEAMAEIRAVRDRNFRDLLKLMDPARARDCARTYAEMLQRPEKERMDYLGMIQLTAIAYAQAFQKARLDRLMTANRFDELDTAHLIVGSARNEPLKALDLVEAGDPIGAAEFIASFEQRATNGEYLPAASAVALRELRLIAEPMMVPPDDQDLLDGLQAARLNDPFQAMAMVDSLKQRARNGAFVDQPLAEMQAELQSMTASYTIPQKDLAPAQQALQQRDPSALATVMANLRSLITTFPPSVAGAKALAKAMGVPDNDPDLRDALNALGQNDANTAKLKLTALQNRSKLGEFGTGGADGMKQELLDLRNDYVIDDGNLVLKTFTDSIDRPEVIGQAINALERLKRMAAAGAFAETN